MASSTRQQFQNVLGKMEQDTKEGITKEQMYMAASIAPGTGEVIAVKELPDDIKQIKKLFEEGYRESDFKKLGMGALYTTAVTAGLLPIAGPLGRAGKKIIKGGLDKAQPLMNKQMEIMQGFPPSGPDALATTNNVPIKSINETNKLLDKTNVSKPIDTSTPSIPSAAELANKPTINPTIIGTQTETGRKAETIYDDLVKQGINDPKVIFKKTGGGYVGSDGKFRFDLDDRDAVLKKNPKDFKFDVDSDGKVLKTKTITLNNLLKYDSIYKEYFKKLKVDGQEFDALKNIKVVLNYGSDTEDALSGSKTLGFYNLNRDYIQLNMKNLISPTRTAQEQADYTMSTLIHEVQHAVQHRETFKNGTSVLDTKDVIFNAIDKDGYYSLPRGAYKKEIDIPYSINISSDKSYSVYQEAGSLEKAIEDGSNSKLINLGDNIFEDIINFTGDRKIEFLRNYEVLLDAKNRLGLYKGEYESLKKIKPTEALIQYANNVFTEDLPFKKIKSAFGFKSNNAFATYVYANLQSEDELISFVNKAYNKARVNIDISDKALVKLEKEQLKRYKQDTALLNYKRDIDNEARRLYRTDYGEMEAQLVEQRYARRQELLRDSNLYTDEQITEKMLDDTSAIFKEPDKYGRTDKILGGFNKRNKGGLQLAKGGVTMYNQMEMFQDGGLKDEGGSIDPISGNDVPSGSTQEEVRDDIPAQLSEGEFVFPADVVRYLGLDLLMKLRQKAKAGLQRMEDMGQMGNSDEAIISDDTPFDLSDLDLEDEPMEMAQGGVVNAANGTFVNSAPNVVYNPSQFAGQLLPTQQYNQNVSPQMYNVPTIPAYNPTPVGGYNPSYFNTITPSTQSISTFENLVGDKYGQYDEMRKYRSESGMILNIPFKGGQPIYPIPEGYMYVDPDDVSADDPTTQDPVTVSPRVDTTQLTSDGNDSDPEMDAGLGGARTTIGGVEYGISYNMNGTISIANVDDAVKSGRASFVQTSPQVQSLIEQQTKGQIASIRGSTKGRQSAIAATTQLSTVTDPYGNRSMGLASIDTDKYGFTPSVSAPSVSDKGQQALDDINAMFGIAEEENNIAGSTSPNVSDPSVDVANVDVENISADVEPDALGNYDSGPNSHGFDSYGSGVADKQGTATGVASNGAISYSPDHDWGQDTQTTVDSGQQASTGSPTDGAPSQGTPADQGLGSINTDNDGGGASDSCFTKGTKVKLYKGGTITIEKLKKGDVVLGIYGEPNEVLGMDIHKVTNDNRPELVQMEGYKKPFITASHPFYKFTPVKNSIYGKNQNFGTGVLMSFNNKQNDQYHPWLGEVENAKEYFKYKKVLAKEGEMLYNLYLDGDHTHYANGLPVHNIVRNGHISFALFYKNYITAKQYEGDIEYVKGVKNRLIRLGYSKIAYPLAYQIMNDTLLGKITAKIATPFVKAMAKSHQENKTSKLMKSLAYLFVYPTCYLRGLIGR